MPGCSEEARMSKEEERRRREDEQRKRKAEEEELTNTGQIGRASCRGYYAFEDR